MERWKDKYSNPNKSVTKFFARLYGENFLERKLLPHIEFRCQLSGMTIIMNTSSRYTPPLCVLSASVVNILFPF